MRPRTEKRCRVCNVPFQTDPDGPDVCEGCKPQQSTEKKDDKPAEST